MHKKNEHSIEDRIVIVIARKLRTQNFKIQKNYKEVSSGEYDDLSFLKVDLPEDITEHEVYSGKVFEIAGRSIGNTQFMLGNQSSWIKFITLTAKVKYNVESKEFVIEGDVDNIIAVKAESC